MKYRDRDSERFVGLGVFMPKHFLNCGVLFRTAASLGNVDFLYTIGPPYERTHADTIQSYKRLPVFNFKDFDDFYDHRPMACDIVAVELHLKSVDIRSWQPPKRVVYLLGAEDIGIPERYVDKCRFKVKLPIGEHGVSMNLSSAGSVVLYHDLLMQNQTKIKEEVL